jgi:4a-hydroxytetrahydrobiopterin dehydratase
MPNLIQKKCVPCEGREKSLKAKDIEKYMSELPDGWEVSKSLKISKLFKFKDFKEAIKFVDQVAVLAEQESHHPNIAIDYNQVNITIWTHSIGGLSENDFILAAKIDTLYN